MFFTSISIQRFVSSTLVFEPLAIQSKTETFLPHYELKTLISQSLVEASAASSKYLASPKTPASCNTMGSERPAPHPQ